MDIRATLIATAAQVAAARAAQSEAAFACKLSASGSLPATHYASAGAVSEAALASLDGLCAITTGAHDPHAVIAAAGLIIVTEPLNG